MTLGQCFDEIREHYLKGSHEAARFLKARVVKIMKRTRKITGPLPKEGWLLQLDAIPLLIHRELETPVPIQVRGLPTDPPPRKVQTYSEKVLRMKIEKYTQN